MAPLDGCDVVIEGLQSKPELNGQTGRAVVFADDTGRYHIRLDSDGSTVALKPSNLRKVNRGGGGGGAPRGAAGAARGFGLPTGLLGGIEPKHLTIALVALLVLGFGFSIVVAGLIGGLCYAAHTAVVREGGVAQAYRATSRSVSDLIYRITGQRLSSAQALFLLVATLFLIWYLWLRDTSSATGSAGGYSSSYSSSRPSSRRSSSHSSRARRASSHDTYDDEDYYGGGYSGLGAGWDLSFLIGAMMLASMVYRMGSSGGGWSVGQFVHSLRNMDMWQMMMFVNLVQQVLGGGRRRGMGYGGYGRGFGFGRRRGFF